MITETLEQSILYMDHLEKLERAQQLLTLYKRSVAKSQRKRHDAAMYYGLLREKYAHQYQIAVMASNRIHRVYHNLIAELYQTSIL